jgi:hypothetical protein
LGGILLITWGWGALVQKSCEVLSKVHIPGVEGKYVMSGAGSKVCSRTSARSFYLLACFEEESRVSRPLLGSLLSLDLGTLSLSCLLLPLSGVLVSDLLLDLGDLLDLEDLGELLLGLLGRLGLVAALPLGETDRLLDDLAGSCWVLLSCLLLPPG